MTSLLSCIWTDQVASAEQSAFMRAVLAQQIWPHRLSSGFPYPGVHVARKTGTLGPFRHEIGVVQHRHEAPIAVAIFTEAARADPNQPGSTRRSELPPPSLSASFGRPSRVTGAGSVLAPFRRQAIADDRTAPRTRPERWSHGQSGGEGLVLGIQGHLLGRADGGAAEEITSVSGAMGGRGQTRRHARGVRNVGAGNGRRDVPTRVVGGVGVRRSSGDLGSRPSAGPPDTPDRCPAGGRSGLRILVLYVRHVSVPPSHMGVAALRTAMAWQRVDRANDVLSAFPPNGAASQIIDELGPRNHEPVFDKLGMSAFVGTPLEVVLPRPGGQHTLPGRQRYSRSGSSRPRTCRRSGIPARRGRGRVRSRRRRELPRVQWQASTTPSWSTDRQPKRSSPHCRAESRHSHAQPFQGL